MADVRIQAIVETRKATKNVERFTRQTQKSVNNLESGFSRLKTAIGAAFGVAVVSQFARGIANTVDGVARLGDQTAKTADKLGFGIEALQEYRFAAEQSGISTEQFDVAIQRFTRRAAEAAQGTGEAQGALKDLGIQLQDANGNLRPTEDLLADVADGFASTQNASERLRIAFKLFDTEGVALVNLLNQGSISIEQFRERARELGGVISSETARAAEDYADAQNELSQATQGVANAVVGELLPALTETAQGITQFITQNRELIVNVLGAAPRAFQLAAEAAAVFIAALAAGRVLAFSKAIIAGGTTLNGFITTLKASRVAVNLFKASITLGLTLVLDALISKIVEAQEEFGGFANGIKAIALGIEESVLGVLASITDSIQNFISQIPNASIFSGLKSGLQGLASASVALKLRQNEAKIALQQLRPAAEGAAQANRDLANSQDQASGAAVRLTEQQQKLIDKIRQRREEQALDNPQERFFREVEALRVAEQQKAITEQEFLNLRAAAFENFQEKRREQARETANQALKSAEELTNKTSAFARERLRVQIDTLEKILESELLTADERAKIETQLAKLREDQAKQGLQNVADTLGNLSSLIKAESKEAFAVQKALNISQAIIAGILAVQQTIAQGGFFALPLAISVGAIAAANVAKIAAEPPPSFQSGITNVPAGFSDDSFPAFLQTGERVVTAPQNQDLTAFLEEERGSKEVQMMILERLNRIDPSVQVQVGGETVVDTVNNELQAGRRLITV